MRVLLIGASGLVGGMVYERLLQRGHKVHALVRRGTGRGGCEHVAPMADWPDMVGAIGSAQTAISCLGTTRRKAGSAQAFRAVDHDAVLTFARAARAAGVGHFLSVSSVGADARSRNLYLRTKGETDHALEELSFTTLDIFRPGLLLGPRDESRPGERIAALLDPLTRRLLRGSLSRFAGVSAEKVAAAIVRAVEMGGSGKRLHENRDMVALADQMLTSSASPR